ncbi:MAG TPA: hypothetical protein VLF93_03235 [Candidatus Saccharimonadales bacterium]|nr:hypothetical protein [Candidatus Saccharimonadales bacterium]
MPKETRKIILLVIFLNLGLYTIFQGLFRIFLFSPYVGIAYYIFESQWCVFLLAGIILSFVSIKNKKVYKAQHTIIYILILFALAALISPWIQEKIYKDDYNAMQKAIVINAIKKDAQSIRSLGFAIYTPTFMPKGFTLKDWDISDSAPDIGKPTNLTLRYEPPNGDEIGGSPVDIISFTEYKDDNILNSQTCEDLKQSDPDWGALDKACMFFVTPNGIKVYRKYIDGEDEPKMLSQLTQKDVDNLFQVTIAFKIGSTVITSPELDLRGLSQYKTSITPDELTKIVDSFSKTTSEEIVSKVSIQDRINNVPRDFIPD